MIFFCDVMSMDRFFLIIGPFGNWMIGFLEMKFL